MYVPYTWSMPPKPSIARGCHCEPEGISVSTNQSVGISFKILSEHQEAI
jgi:hypothetical protein